MNEQPVVVHLPRCQIPGCRQVSTRSWYSLTVDDQAQEPIRICWRHEKQFGLDENEIYETEQRL